VNPGSDLGGNSQKPPVIRLPGIVVDARFVLRNQQVVRQRDQMLVVGKFPAPIERLRGGRQDFDKNSRIHKHVSRLIVEFGFPANDRQIRVRKETRR